MNVSQPSVSKVLKHAEIQLGFKLFEREKGKLLATPEAEALIREVNSVYGQINSLRKTARNLRTNAIGSVRVSVVPALGLDVLPLAIRRFHASHPNVSFNVQTKHHDTVQEALAEYEIDLGFVFDSPLNPQFNGEVIGRGELVCVHTPGLFSNKTRINISELTEHDTISILDSGPLGDIVEAQLATLDKPLQSLIQVQTYYIAKNLVSHGLGLAIVDEFTASAAASNGLQVTHFDQRMPFEVKGCTNKDHPLSQVSSKFLQCIHEVLEEGA